MPCPLAARLFDRASAGRTLFSSLAAAVAPGLLYCSVLHCLLLAGTASAQSEPIFSGAQVLLGGGVTEMLVEDFSGDGIPDLFASQVVQNQVAYAQGRGDGTFETAIIVPVVRPQAIAAGDIDNNGFTDAVVIEFDLGELRIHSFLSDGLGEFTQSVIDWPGPLGRYSTGIELGDIDGDGVLDLVASVFRAQTEPEFPLGFVTTLIGDGNGGFTPSGLLQDVGDLPRDLLLADFDENGTLDAAVANNGTNNVSILFGDGVGGFPTSSTIAVAIPVQRLSVADLDLDTHLDLLMGVSSGPNAGILSGDGAGAFVLDMLSFGQTARRVLAADLNGDGWVDVVGGEGRPALLLNDQAGGFTPGVQFSPPNVFTLNAADLTGDGKLELVVGQGSQGASIQFTHADGHFSGALGYDENASWIVAHDFDADGQEDLLFQRLDTGGIDGISMRLGLGDGTYGAESILPTAHRSMFVSIVDWDGDGLDDVISVNLFEQIFSPSMQSVSIHLNDGLGGFASPGPELVLSVIPVAIDSADLDGDGIPELVVLDGANVLTRYGPAPGGTIGTGAVIDIPAGRHFVLEDMTRDGLPDYVSIETDVVTIRANDGMGNFTTATVHPIGLPPSPGLATSYELRVVDFDSDGWNDLVVARIQIPLLAPIRIAGLRSTATGFAAPVFAPGTGPVAGVFENLQMDFGDLDGDGFLDIVVGGGAASIYRGLGALGWSGPELLTGNSVGIALTDADADGYVDLIASMSEFFVLRNRDLAPEGVEPFGIGTPGCDGVQLALTNRSSALGATDFAYTCNNAPANSFGLVAGSQLELDPGVLAVGVLVHLNPAGPLFRLDLVQSDANGIARFATPLPSNPSLAGLTYTRQFVWVWPVDNCSPSALGWSTSRGVTVTLH